MIIKNCLSCNKEFKYRNCPSDIAHNGGKYCSKTCQNNNMSKVLKERGIKPLERYVGRGQAHGKWKGDKVSYSGLHYWISRELGKPSECEHCGRTDAKKFEWANKSGLYLRELTDWIRLCTPCHRKYDYQYSIIYASRGNSI